MKHNLKLRLLAGLTLTAILLVSIFAAIPTGHVQAAARMVNLTIDNRANNSITLSLRGPYQYQLKVSGKSSETFRVMTGNYEYTVQGCGMSGTSKLAITQDMRLINPICGGNVRTIPKDSSKVNIGASIRVVPVTISNDLGYRATVILTGPYTYVFTLKSDQDLKVTIGKGDYNVRYYACGTFINRSFQAYKNAKYILRCP